jgi:hypothetical protein
VFQDRFGCRAVVIVLMNRCRAVVIVLMNRCRAVVIVLMNIWHPQNVVSLLTGFGAVSLTIRIVFHGC